MTRDWKMEVYGRLPVFLQEAALSLYAGHLDRLYYGPKYAEWRDQFRDWRAWPRARIDAWQDERLARIVELAATRVPYYRSAWRDVEWKSARSTATLSVLPLLDKQAIRRNEAAFLVDGVDPRRLWVEKTSGTTGTSLRCYWPLSMLPAWWALYEVTVREVAGVGQPIPRAMMGGRPVVRGDARRPPYWRYNRRWRQLYLSSYHVSLSTALGYSRAIRRYGSEWITGYGSAIAALAESAIDAGAEPVPLRTAIVSGDTLSPAMRASIETFFRCKCFDNYGQSEGVCAATECAHGRMHVIPAAGVIEIVRDDGSACEPGEIGEVVATGLLNDAMPLVRYRIGDYAAWATDQHCSCGNPNPILVSLEGRVDDYLLLPDGRRIGRLSTAMKRSPTIHSAQILQDRPDHAYLLVRPSDGYRPDHASAVREDILERIGDFDLEVVEVPEIPKTPQGKLSLVVRLWDRPHMKEAYERLLRHLTTPRALA
jgi:phenylacetate-CoA ligase